MRLEDLVRLVAGDLLEGRVDVKDPGSRFPHQFGLGHHHDVVYAVHRRSQHVRWEGATCTETDLRETERNALTHATFLIIGAEVARSESELLN